MKKNVCEDARNTYNTVRWSEGYFDINAHGQVAAMVHGDDSKSALLTDIIKKSKQLGLSLPLLVRFPDILTHRVQRLESCFEAAMAEAKETALYHPVYPIKVNQQRRIIRQFLENPRVGLESGSKSELMAVLSLAQDRSRLIICNGYKDREYVRLAFIGLQLGHDVTLILEKESELDLVLDEAKSWPVRPKLGVRIRLSTVGKGNWQNTGGEKSKFGVTAQQCLNMVERLKRKGYDDCLTVLHAHLGSQVAQLSDLQNGLAEIARWYVTLRDLGLAIAKVDVGGGLGVDYEGTQSRDFCSMNYSMEEYSTAVVRQLSEASKKSGYEMPDIITESGRAMTAHHAVLLTQVIDKEEPLKAKSNPDIDHPLIVWLHQAEQKLNSYNAVELYHQLVNTIQESQRMFVSGTLAILVKAEIEKLYYGLLTKIQKCLDLSTKTHRALSNELSEKLATKYFCNFSLFQSLPDIWAIDQIFPILPIEGLDKPLSHRGILKDITCDSDGRIEQYVDGKGVESTLPLPPLKPHSVFAVFMVGAYQEILGDMHNLFGHTDSVHVMMTENGFELVEPLLGSTKEDALKTVQFDARIMLQSFKSQIESRDLDALCKQKLFQQLAACLSGGTYLQVDL